MKVRGGTERGATLPLVALSLVLLIGLAAIVVDIGNGRQIRRQAFAAVDAAALAAVVDYNGTSATEAAATTRAIEYVDDNGFPPAATTINVTFSINALGEPCVTVHIQNYPVATFFSRIWGTMQLPVSAISTGCQTPGDVTLPGLFAGGSCTGSGKAFVTSGNNNRMEGSIHSNFDAKESGNDNDLVSGTATYTSNPLDVSGSGTHWWDPATYVGPTPQPWPVTFNISDYQPGGARAVAAGAWYYDFTGSNIIRSGNVQAGLYYTDRQIELTSVTVVPFNGKTGATFVTSGGLIELKGDSVIRPFQDEPTRLTFFAGWQEPGKTGALRCDSETMKVSGNCNQFDGVLYVPNGKFTASGEGNGNDYNTGSGQCSSRPRQLTFNGGVLAWAINVNGNYNLYRGGNVPGGSGSPYLSS